MNQIKDEQPYSFKRDKEDAIAIIKYNAGNIKSVQNALTRLGYKSMVTDDFECIRSSKKVIFPGVGEASSAMKYLKERGLDALIKSLKQPVLGICFGLQLMCKSSEEGNVDCLGVFNAKVKKFPPKDKVPHMGWNDFLSKKNHPLLKNIELTDAMYYVHSYYAENSLETIATCDYILPFSSVMQKDNFYGVQFHPEKSAEAGERLLLNFLTM